MKITIERTCPMCGTKNKVEVEEKDYVDFKENGKLAQWAFPYLTPEERELIISGICNNCWDTIFDEDDEDIEVDIDELAESAIDIEANYDD